MGEIKREREMDGEDEHGRKQEATTLRTRGDLHTNDKLP
jgi:hypothetical protein